MSFFDKVKDTGIKLKDGTAEMVKNKKENLKDSSTIKNLTHGEVGQYKYDTLYALNDNTNMLPFLVLEKDRLEKSKENIEYNLESINEILSRFEVKEEVAVEVEHSECEEVVASEDTL